MKQQLFPGSPLKPDKDVTLWEISFKKHPVVWEVGRKYIPETDSYKEVNGRPKDDE